MTSTLYYGGDLLTMLSPVPAQALLVKDGIIQAVGNLDSLKSLAPHARQVNLQGCTLMPAFLDAHSQLTALARTFDLVSLADARSFSDIHGILKKYARRLEARPGEWILGSAYDQKLLREHRHLTRDLLDQWFPDNPVLLSHVDEPMGIANSRALQKIGFLDHSPDPEGGLLGRDRDTGKLNGCLEKTAFTIYGKRAVPQPSRRQLLRQLKMAEQAYLAQGITTIQDGLTGVSQWELLLEASQESAFQADVIAYADFRKCPRLLREYPVHKSNYDHHLRLGGYTIILDAPPRKSTDSAARSYGNHRTGGHLLYRDCQVMDFFLRAYEEEYQLLLKCHQPGATAQMIKACQMAIAQRNGQRLPISDIRPVALHPKLTAWEQFSALAGCSMLAAFSPDQPFPRKDNLPENHRGFISLPMGEPSFTIYGNPPSLLPDMLEDLRALATCFPEDLICGESRTSLALLEGLRTMTRAAAYQYHEENQKGALAPGLWADFVILSDNPLAVAPENFGDIRILATIKEDIPVYLREAHTFFPA